MCVCGGGCLRTHSLFQGKKIAYFQVFLQNDTYYHKPASGPGFPFWAHRTDVLNAQETQPHSDVQEQSSFFLFFMNELTWNSKPHPIKLEKIQPKETLQRHHWSGCCPDTHCCSLKDMITKNGHQEWWLWLCDASTQCWDPAFLSTPSSHFPLKSCTFSGSDISPTPASEQLLEKPLTSLRPFLFQLSSTASISLAFPEGRRNHELPTASTFHLAKILMVRN